MSKYLICTISHTFLTQYWNSNATGKQRAEHTVHKYMKTKFSSCLVAKTDSLVAKRNVASVEVIHIWSDKEVLWLKVIKVFSKGQVGKVLMALGKLLNLTVRWKTWSTLEIILLYIFLRFCRHWITSYVTNLLGSTLLMQMQRNT